MAKIANAMMIISTAFSMLTPCSLALWCGVDLKSIVFQHHQNIANRAAQVHLIVLAFAYLVLANP